MLAREREMLIAPVAEHDLELLLEDVDPGAHRREGKAVGLVLALMPARAEAERHPATTDVVGGDDQSRELGRVAKRGR